MGKTLHRTKKQLLSLKPLMFAKIFYSLMDPCCITTNLTKKPTVKITYVLYTDVIP